MTTENDLLGILNLIQGGVTPTKDILHLFNLNHRANTVPPAKTLLDICQSASAPKGTIIVCSTKPTEYPTLDIRVPSGAYTTLTLCEQPRCLQGPLRAPITPSPHALTTFCHWLLQTQNPAPQWQARAVPWTALAILGHDALHQAAQRWTVELNNRSAWSGFRQLKIECPAHPNGSWRVLNIPLPKGKGTPSSPFTFHQDIAPVVPAQYVNIHDLIDAVEASLHLSNWTQEQGPQPLIRYF